MTISASFTVVSVCCMCFLGIVLYKQFAKEEEEGVLPDFDYMIMTIGSDMLCGRDLDIMVYAKDMPSEYEYYKCVGFNASEYLKNVEFPSTEFTQRQLNVDELDLLDLTKSLTPEQIEYIEYKIELEAEIN